MSSNSEWAWWVVRDDGDRCAGPFDTKDEAERIWRHVFDISEYRVDYQYAVPDIGKQPTTDQSELAEMLRAAAARVEGRPPDRPATEEAS